LQKSLPGLRRRLRRSRDIFRDRRLGHLKAKHQKFAMDPGCAPAHMDGLRASFSNAQLSGAGLFVFKNQWSGLIGECRRNANNGRLAFPSQ
jgi:hypothetical protein